MAIDAPKPKTAEQSRIGTPFRVESPAIPPAIVDDVPSNWDEDV